LSLLLSLSHKFIFVANLKNRIGRRCESAIGEQGRDQASRDEVRQDDGLSAISNKFAWN